MMNSTYFDECQSVAVYAGKNDKRILEIIAQHFMGNHPSVPFQYKMDFDNGIVCDMKGRYQFNFGDRFPNAPIGSWCVARGRIWSHQDKTSVFVITCVGLTVCRVNEEEVFRSVPNEEGKRSECKFKTNIKKGWNEFWFMTEKTERGFGFEMGNSMAQWEPYLFQSPLIERSGQLGFIFSQPITEDDKKLRWFPDLAGNEDCDKTRVRPNIPFGDSWIGTCYAKAAIYMKKAGKILIIGSGMQNLKIYLDGVPCRWEEGLEIKKGRHSLIFEIKREHIDEKTEYKIETVDGEIGGLPKVRGYDGAWLYLGPFHEKKVLIGDLMEMCKIYKDGSKRLYWRTGIRHGVVRVCTEAELFGRWTYPMGVTLYGILKTADYLRKNEYAEYVKQDVEQITMYQEYALFDKERYGFPSLNQQICWLTELDDCGSFGSLMLECNKRWPDPHAEDMAQSIAYYMRFIQKRQADGAFCRHDDTMWIDDLYMSIPFLVRYYLLSKDKWYLDEACRQMLLFKKYFYMEDKKLMSHIYDVKWECANRIPWSRGNGWVLFSMSELMEVMPKDYENREKITSFYNNMVEGVLDVQGKHGMWHQVLDDCDTYEESSSTAMFICAFSRGIRRGYADSRLADRMKESVEKAWKGLTERAVDCSGNLYGVCQGSGCSFSREYYRNLSWRYNDVHGIGIVLLAGVEKCLMEDSSEDE